MADISVMISTTDEIILYNIMYIKYWCVIPIILVLFLFYTKRFHKHML